MAQPLLTIDTLEPNRPTIIVDRVEYELALPDDFGLTESARLARIMAMTRDAEADVADPKKALTPAAIDRLDQMLDGLIRLIVLGPVGGAGGGLPAPVLGRLNSGQKLQIVSAFAPAVTNRAASPKPPTRAQPHRSTSGKPSPSSRRRTARPTGTACRSVA